MSHSTKSVMYKFWNLQYTFSLLLHLLKNSKDISAFIFLKQRTVKKERLLIFHYLSGTTEL